MAAHGCRNPVIYPQPLAKEDGALDFGQLEIVLKNRELAGMPKDRLYLLGAGRVNSSQQIDAEQYKLNVQQVRELVTYLKKRGYGDVYLMGADEATGAALMAQRDAGQSGMTVGRTFSWLITPATPKGLAICLICRLCCIRCTHAPTATA